MTDVLTWAGAVTEITGYSIEEFQKFDSKIWFEHVHPKDRERVLAELRKFKEKDSQTFRRCTQMYNSFADLSTILHYRGN